MVRVLLATALLCLAVAAAAVAHTRTFPTGSSFGYDPAREDFLGEINFGTGPRGCQSGRRVRLFRQRPGDDRLMGATRSGTSPGDGPGYWVIKPPSVPAGRYYVKILQRDIAPGSAHTHLCRPYRSSALPVS
jgi:hypothetical protein